MALRNNSGAPRVLYLPNEGSLDRLRGQVGGRYAFGDMQRDGLISELKCVSFLTDYRADGYSDAHRYLLDQAAKFQPDIVFWQHPGGFPIDRDFIKEFRRVGGNPLLAYHEGDVYDRFYKRIGPSEKALYLESDVFFSVALGEGREVFQKLRTHRHFYYSPHNVDLERFGAVPDTELIGSRYDAVMIGSIAYRFRMLKFPGSAERIEIARQLTRLMGERFATFGNRWPARTNCKGFLDFNQQAKTIQSAMMSIIWENFSKYSFYFSDRLPIALASGVPHITSKGPGYEVMLGNVPGLFLANSVNEAVDIACYLRSLPKDEIVALGASAREWVLSHLESGVVFRRAFERCVQIWKAARGE